MNKIQKNNKKQEITETLPINKEERRRERATTPQQEEEKRHKRGRERGTLLLFSPTYPFTHR